MKNLISIGGVDLTEYVDVGTYAIASEKEYTTWMDANYRIHREVERTRVKGTITMSFINGMNGRITLNDLLAIIATATAYGVTTFSVYDMSIGQMVTINGYIDIVGEEHVGTQNQNFDRVTLNVEEA